MDATTEGPTMRRVTYKLGGPGDDERTVEIMTADGFNSAWLWIGSDSTGVFGWLADKHRLRLLAQSILRAIGPPC